jgi:hypothetical protein
VASAWRLGHFWINETDRIQARKHIAFWLNAAMINVSQRARIRRHSVFIADDFEADGGVNVGSDDRRDNQFQLLGA